jgi:hypothetical protein
MLARTEASTTITPGPPAPRPGFAVTASLLQHRGRVRGVGTGTTGCKISLYLIEKPPIPGERGLI